MQTPLAIGFLNCYKKSEALTEAITHISDTNRDWILGLCEPPVYFKDEEVLSKCETLVTSQRNGQAAIIASSNDWELFWAPTDADLIVIKGFRQNLDIFITCVYVSSKHDMKDKKKIRTTLRVHHEFLRNHRTSHHIFLGDLNSRHELWSYEKADECGRIIANCLLHLRMISAVIPSEDTWTRMDTTSGRKSWIDAFLTTPKLHKRIVNSYISDSSHSDHRMITAIFSGFLPGRRLNQKRLNILAKEADLNFMLKLPGNSKEADDNLIKLESIMIEITESSFGPAVYNKKFDYPRALSRIIRTSNRRHKKFLINRERFPHQVPKLHRLCQNAVDRYNIRKIGKIFKAIRYKHERKKIASIAERKGEWAIINKFLGKEFKIWSPNLSHKPPDSHDLDISLEEISKKYKNKKIDITPNRNLEVIFDFSEMMNSSNESLSLVKSTIRKPCSFDKFLSCRSLKALMKYHGQILFNYFAFCVACGHTPQFMKKSRTQLIPKKDPNKFRPLSILHPLYRAFDAIIFWILTKSIDPKLLEFQFGFLQNCNAIDLHYSLKLQINLLLKDNLPLAIIAIDLSDAFEKISFEAIKCGLKKLGINDNLIKIVVGHIINRQSFIDRADGRKWFSHTSGAPQGGFLSPLAFIVGLNIIWNIASYNFRILTYADDIIIVVQADDFSNWTSTNTNMKKISTLLEAMNLHINPSKTKAMVVGDQSSINSWNNQVKIPPCTRINILGVKLRYNRPDKNVISCLESSEKLTDISRKFFAFSTKIRSLTLHRAHLLITSTIKGNLMYYGCLERIWTNHDVFHKECKKTMSRVGGIIKTTMGYKVGLHHVAIFYIFFREHLATLIERTQGKYLNSNSKLKIKPMNLIDRHKLDPYGINIVPLHDYHQNFKPVKITRMINDFMQPTISYQRIAINFDHWFRTFVSIDGEIISSKIFCSWTHGASYLDCLEDVIYQTIISSQEIYNRKTFVIEADVGFKERILTSKNRSRLTDLFSSKNFELALECRSKGRFYPSSQERRTTPRTVIEGSKQYWELLDIYSHLSEIELYSSNIVLASLLFSRFRIFKDWKRVMRVDLYSIALLLGLWRNDEYRETCPSCDTKLNTQKLIFGCCTHIPPIKCKAIQVNEKNIVKILSTLMTFRMLAAGFRANLNRIRKESLDT